MEVFIVIDKENKDAGVFVDKQGIANFLGIHRNTVYRWLRHNNWFEDLTILIIKANFQKSNRGGLRTPKEGDVSR